MRGHNISEMDLRSRMLTGLASQLGRPSGFRGRLVAAMLNRSNHGVIAGAVDALALQPGGVAADLGFGGGVGLALLLARVGPDGQVHGVDLSQTMVRRAAGRYGREVAGGRLHLHEGSITELPLEAGSIDGAVTINTIYFIAELDRAFSELARVLARSGRGVVGIGDPIAMGRMPMIPFGFRLRPVDEVIAIAKAGGLDLHQHRRVGKGEGAAHLLVFEHAPR